MKKGEGIFLCLIAAIFIGLSLYFGLCFKDEVKCNKTMFTLEECIEIVEQSNQIFVVDIEELTDFTEEELVVTYEFSKTIQCYLEKRFTKAYQEKEKGK